MPDPSNQRVTCPSCGHAYRWQPAAAGRTVSCKKCDASFIVPDQPGPGLSLDPKPEQDDGTYELDIKDEPTRSVADAAPPQPARINEGKCPVCNAKLREGAVICMTCGFNLQEGKKVTTDVASEPTDKDESTPEPELTKQQKRDLERAQDATAQHLWQDYKLPLILAVAGIVLAFVNLLAAPMSNDASFGLSNASEIRIAKLFYTALLTPVNAALLFGGLLLNVVVFKAAFGNLWSVLLKVIAITLVAQESAYLFIVIADIVIGAGLIAVLLNWLLYLSLMVIMCIKLLDVDGAEIRLLVAFMVVSKFAGNFFINALIMMMF